MNVQNGQTFVAGKTLGDGVFLVGQDRFYFAVLKGMVRQEDIGFGFKDGLRYRNIVSSQYIADAQIEFVSKGSLDDAQKESWYQKLSTILNPF